MARKTYVNWKKKKKKGGDIHTVSAMQNDTKAESQTAFMGTSCPFTLCQTDENGMAPSLENA
jgi:hypothetical protein